LTFAGQIIETNAAMLAQSLANFPADVTVLEPLPDDYVAVRFYSRDSFPDSPQSAADLVNTAGEEELARIFRELGDEPAARRIAALPALFRRKRREQQAMRK